MAEMPFALQRAFVFLLLKPHRSKIEEMQNVETERKRERESVCVCVCEIESEKEPSV